MVPRDSDLFVERLVQSVKKPMSKRRVVRNLEASAANELLRHAGLEQHRVDHPAAAAVAARLLAAPRRGDAGDGSSAGATAAAAAAAVGPGLRSARARLATRDVDARGWDDCVMLDAGAPVGERLAELEEVLEGSREALTADGWTLPLALAALRSGAPHRRALLFKRAQLPRDGGVVETASYERSTRRVSSWVRASWEDDGPGGVPITTEYVCEVADLLLLLPPPQQQLPAASGDGGSGGGGGGDGGGDGGGFDFDFGGGASGGGASGSGASGNSASGSSGGAAAASPSQAPSAPLRLALLEVYRRQASDIVESMQVIRAGVVYANKWAVPLSNVTSKVMVACPQGYKQGKMFALRYTTMSRLPR